MIDVEKYFLAIANTTSDMIHLNDADGRIIYANQATEKALGYPLNKLINTYAFEIIHPDDREIIKADMFTISRGNQLPAREIRLLAEDGSYIDVEVRGFLVSLEKDTYIGAIIRDISNRKKTEMELDGYRNRLEALVRERTLKLEQAIREIKTLQGVIPICFFCKKIRDD